MDRPFYRVNALKVATTFDEIKREALKVAEKFRVFPPHTNAELLSKL